MSDFETNPIGTKARLEELERLINTPELEDFSRAVVLEAAHQRDRWGAEHDARKTPEDWFSLVGWLMQKGITAIHRGDRDKATHHLIATAAALNNWHAQLSEQQQNSSAGS